MAVRSRPVWMGAAVWYHIELASGFLPSLEGSQPSEEFLMYSLVRSVHFKKGRRIPFLKGTSLPLALSTVLVFWSPVNENSWINAAFGAAVFCCAGGLILMFYDEKKINCVMNGKA